jgi:hypothetical protein
LLKSTLVRPTQTDVKRIELDGENVKVHYNLPMPSDVRMRESLGVPPVVTSGGEGGTRTPMPFQRMILSH